MWPSDSSRASTCRPCRWTCMNWQSGRLSYWRDASIVPGCRRPSRLRPERTRIAFPESSRSAIATASVRTTDSRWSPVSKTCGRWPRASFSRGIETGKYAPVIAGVSLMPLYQKQGSDGFFIVRDVKRIWLSLSTLARRLRSGPVGQVLARSQPSPDTRRRIGCRMDRGPRASHRSVSLSGLSEAER